MFDGGFSHTRIRSATVWSAKRKGFAATTKNKMTEPLKPPPKSVSKDLPEFQKIKLKHVPKVKRRAPQPPHTLPIRKVCQSFLVSSSQYLISSIFVLILTSPFVFCSPFSRLHLLPKLPA